MAPTHSGAAPRLLDPEALSDHLDRLYRAARAMCGSHADAEDLVQEVCVRVLAKPRVVRGDDRAYLLGVLRNTFISHCRSRKRQTTVEPSTLHNEPDPGRFDPELGALAREVHREITALPDHYRDVVIAVDILGLPYSEAATVLGLPVGTIMSRLSRGRSRVSRLVDMPAVAA